MRKSAFLAELRASLCAAGDAALARAGRDTKGCPHIEKWLATYAARPASQLERAMRKLAPAAGGVRSAREYIPLVTARVVRGINTWIETGKIPDDIPDELRAELPGAGGVVGAIA